MPIYTNQVRKRMSNPHVYARNPAGLVLPAERWSCAPRRPHVITYHTTSKFGVDLLLWSMH